MGFVHGLEASWPMRVVGECSTGCWPLTMRRGMLVTKGVTYSQPSLPASGELGFSRIELQVTGNEGRQAAARNNWRRCGVGFRRDRKTVFRFIVRPARPRVGYGCAFCFEGFRTPMQCRFR